MFESDKVMFEIYREADYAQQYGVVYFTEWNEHNKETEINRAMAGEHFFACFLEGTRDKRGQAPRLRSREYSALPVEQSLSATPPAKEPHRYL